MRLCIQEHYKRYKNVVFSFSFLTLGTIISQISALHSRPKATEKFESTIVQKLLKKKHEH